MPLPKRLLTRRKYADSRRKATAAVQQDQTGSEDRASPVECLVDESTPEQGDHGEASNPATELQVQTRSEECAESRSAYELLGSDFVETGTNSATPLKLLSPCSFSTAQELHPVTPERSCATAKCVEIPNRLSDWKLHRVGSKVTLCRLLGMPDERPPVCVTHILSFDNGKWELWIHGQLVAPAALSFPTTCTSSAVEQLLSNIEALRICEGVVDSSLVAMVDLQVHGASLDVVPTIDRNDVVHLRTVRDTACEMLVSGQIFRCHKCTLLKEALRQKVHRGSKPEATHVYKFTPNVHLSTPQKLEKLAKLAADKVALQKMIASLSVKIQGLYAKDSVSLDPSLDADLATIMASETDTISKALPEGSFRRLFWQQQMDALSCKDPRQRRWHPLIIKWCLNLKMMSSAAYHNLRTSGMLVLPSERTLRDYSNVVKAGEGFNLDVLRQLFDEARMGNDSIPYHRRFVGILYDEIYIQEDLVYDRHSSRLIGFVNLGAVDKQVSELETAALNSSPAIATRILTLMVRGIFDSLHFPLANFPTVGLKGVSLYDILWEAVEHLERCDFIVLFQTGDGCSPNRNYYRIHEHGTIPHKAVNVYSTTNKILYFFSDAPHLLKTARNSLSHSGYSRQRLLWNNGLTLEWKHVEQLYEATIASAAKSAGLMLAHKFTREHVYLNSYSRMRVDLAAQVLSRTTSEAMNYYGIPGSAATQTFLVFMDRFFDMLNVRHPDESIHKRKEDLRPYRSVDDERLQWLEDGFLGYLDRWEHSVHHREGFSKTEQELMLLSRETREGLRITVKSLVGVIRDLLKDPGLKSKYILSAKFNQDPLENFFGQVRQSGGWSNNPSSKRVQEATDVIRLQTSSAMDEVRSSTRAKKKIFGAEGPKIDDTSLPKRVRKSFP